MHTVPPLSLPPSLALLPFMSADSSEVAVWEGLVSGGAARGVAVQRACHCAGGHEGEHSDPTTPECHPALTWWQHQIAVIFVYWHA